MKRIFSILLSFALCFININTTVSAEENNSSIISIESVTGTIGETISVPITIKDNPGIISLVTEISYDNSALSFKGVNKSADFWKSATMTPGGDLNAQPYRIIWYDGLSNSDFTEDGTLAELSFEVLKTGSHVIDLSISSSDTFNNNFVKVPFEVKNGVIEVVSSTTSTTTSKPTTTTTSKVTTTTTTLSNATTTSTTTTLPSVEYKLGDVNNNGTIDAVDASTVLAYYAMISTNKDGGFDNNQKAAADVDHDGKINAVDASNILSYYAYVSTTKEEIMSMEEFMKKK